MEGFWGTLVIFGLYKKKVVSSLGMMHLCILMLKFEVVLTTEKFLKSLVAAQELVVGSFKSLLVQEYSLKMRLMI
jgi:hypothetical protein